MKKQGTAKRARKQGQSGGRKRTLKHNETPKKATTRASDIYEAEDRDPAEELEAGRRYDVCIGVVETPAVARPASPTFISPVAACRELRV